MNSNRPVVVLVVDDDILIARHYAQRLERNGFVQGHATTALAAAATIQHLLPDVLVVDHYMLDLDGSAFIDAFIRNSPDPRCRNIAVVGVSAFPEAEPLLLAAGADVFVRKPIVRDSVLINAVQAAWNKRKSPDQIIG